MHISSGMIRQQQQIASMQQQHHTPNHSPIKAVHKAASVVDNDDATNIASNITISTLPTNTPPSYASPKSGTPTHVKSNSTSSFFVNNNNVASVVDHPQPSPRPPTPLIDMEEDEEVMAAINRMNESNDMAGASTGSGSGRGSIIRTTQPSSLADRRSMTSMAHLDPVSSPAAAASASHLLSVSNPHDMQPISPRTPGSLALLSFPIVHDAANPPQYMQGMLTKKGRNLGFGLGFWRTTRLYTLNDSELSFADKSKKNVKAHHRLDEMKSVVRLASRRWPTRCFTLRFQDDKLWHLRAPTAGECTAWVDSLVAAIASSEKRKARWRFMRDNAAVQQMQQIQIDAHSHYATMAAGMPQNYQQQAAATFLMQQQMQADRSQMGMMQMPTSAAPATNNNMVNGNGGPGGMYMPPLHQMAAAHMQLQSMQQLQLQQFQYQQSMQQQQNLHQQQQQAMVPYNNAPIPVVDQPGLFLHPSDDENLHQSRAPAAVPVKRPKSTRSQSAGAGPSSPLTPSGHHSKSHKHHIQHLPTIGGDDTTSDGEPTDEEETGSGDDDADGPEEEDYYAAPDPVAIAPPRAYFASPLLPMMPMNMPMMPNAYDSFAAVQRQAAFAWQVSASPLLHPFVSSSPPTVVDELPALSPVLEEFVSSSSSSSSSSPTAMSPIDCASIGDQHTLNTAKDLMGYGFAVAAMIAGMILSYGYQGRTIREIGQVVASFRNGRTDRDANYNSNGTNDTHDYDDDDNAASHSGYSLSSIFVLPASFDLLLVVSILSFLFVVYNVIRFKSHSRATRSRQKELKKRKDATAAALKASPSTKKSLSAEESAAAQQSWKAESKMLQSELEKTTKLMTSTAGSLVLFIAMATMIYRR